MARSRTSAAVNLPSRLVMVATWRRPGCKMDRSVLPGTLVVGVDLGGADRPLRRGDAVLGDAWALPVDCGTLG